jgi:hypothetical protein
MVRSAETILAAHLYSKMVFHNHFRQWFETIVSLSILNGLA